MKKGVIKNKLTLVVLGRSGSGKDTQIEFILRRLRPQGVCYMGTGELLRSFVKKNNHISRLAAHVIETGGLIPAWLVSFLWSKELIEKERIREHLVFSGAPRRPLEAELLDEAMAWYGRLPPLCIQLDVSPKEATKRLLLRGRSDDSPKVIKNRLAYFPKYVEPVLRFYRQRRRLIIVDGEQPVEKVWQDIDRALAKRLGNWWSRK